MLFNISAIQIPFFLLQITFCMLLLSHSLCISLARSLTISSLSRFPAKALGWEYSITHPPLTVNTHFGSHYPVHHHMTQLPHNEFIRSDQPPPLHRMMVTHPPHWIIQTAGGGGGGGGGYQQFGPVGGVGVGSTVLLRTTESYRRPQFYWYKNIHIYTIKLKSSSILMSFQKF